MNTLTVGSVVEVRTKRANTFLPTYKQQPYVYKTYVGKVVTNPKWLDADYVSVETGNEMHPVSFIHLSAIDGIKIVEGKRSSFQEFPVVGSKNQVYTVKKSNNHYSCNCTGFKYHSQCKHIALVKDDFYG